VILQGARKIVNMILFALSLLAFASGGYAVAAKIREKIKN
jgi:hypothetical protein